MSVRCQKCKGFLFYEIFREGGAIVEYYKCINCGARYFKPEQKEVVPPRAKKKVCVICGKEIYVMSDKRKYCYTCSNILRRGYMKKHTKKCNFCGREIVVTNKRVKYCNDCRRVVLSMIATERKRIKKEVLG